MYRQAVIVVGLLLCTRALADDFIGTRPLGMGNAYRAVVTGNDAIFLNPAGMALFKSYSFEAEYLITPKYLSKDGPTEHVIQGSVVDNSTLQLFATGVAYTRVQRGDEKTGNRFDTAFAVPLSENFFFGLDAKYLDFDRSGQNKDLKAITIDAGALMRTSIGLSLGVVGYNLTNTADYIEHPISMGAAVMYSPFRTLEVAFDWLINFQKPKDASQPGRHHRVGYSYNVGGEYLLLDQFVVRGGYSYDQTSPYGDAHFVAAGIGYVSSQFTIDLGYRGSPSRNYGHVFGVTLRFLLQEQQVDTTNRE
jgi:long-subunit fatty acid transport protein